jgi:hypothetical protein
VGGNVVRWFGLLLVTLMAVGMATAQQPSPAILQPPIPSSGEHHGPEQTKTADQQDKEPADQHITESVPVVVKVLNTPNTPAETDNDSYKKLEKPAPNWWGPDWSIVWATLILAGVGTGQLVMFFVQLRYMRQGVNDAKTAAEAAKDAANATRILAAAANLSAKAAIALELPLLRAFPSNPIILSEAFSVADHYAGQINMHGPMTQYAGINEIFLRNDGRTHAIPVNLGAGWSVVDQLPEEPSYTTTRAAWAQSIAKENETVGTALAVAVRMTDEQLLNIHNGTCHFWLYLSVEYLDFMDRMHEARFCWRWERRGVNMHQWIPHNDVPAAYTLKN